MQKLPSTKSCFVCGTSNPVGLKLTFETDGTVVRTRFIAQPVHVGFQGVVHGGIVSTVLDEVMAWACYVGAGRFGYCAELNVRFVRPLSPGQEVIATAELISNRRDKLFEVRGEIRDEAGTALATATGKYLALKDEEAKLLMSDLEGDPAEVIRKLKG